MKTTVIKAEGPGSPIEQEFTQILDQLEIQVETPEKKQEILEQVRVELSRILPGNWQSCTTRDQFLKEFERVIKEQEKARAEDPGAGLRNAFRTKRAENKK